MSDKFKVLHVIHGFGAGGAETWLLSAVRYLKSNPQCNLHFDFLATGGLPSIYDEEILEQGPRIFYIRYSFRCILQFRKKVKQLLKREHYDAIHDHQDFVSGWHFFSLIGLMPSVRIVHLHNPFNFVRNYITDFPRYLSYKLGRSLMIIFATKLTGTSNAVMDEYGYHKKPFSSKRFKPVYCGFDIDEFTYQSSAKTLLCKQFGWSILKTKIALFVGRVEKQLEDTAVNQKNPEFAFDIATQMVKDDKWKFIFVGEKGNHPNTLEIKAKEIGLASNIIFTGVRKDISFLMSAADVLVFPSLWEGLGMVAVEAQCNGLTVVMSDKVPKEAIIIDELVHVCPLEKTDVWVEKIRSVSNYQRKREQYASTMASSPFAIEHSVMLLSNLYQN